MITRRLLYLAFIATILCGCGSPFAPKITAPTDAPVISSPSDLPKTLKVELQGTKTNWGGIPLSLDTGETKDWPPKQPDSVNPFFSRFSTDGRYYVFINSPLVVGENGLPTSGNETIGVTDFETSDVSTLISKIQSFTNADSFASATFTFDNENVVFVVFGEEWVDLVKINLADRKFERLNVDVLLSGWGKPDISTKGQYVVICADQRSQRPISELCLLDESGKFIRYLTEEGYQWPGYGRFTPDGEWVIYESRNELYKVRTDGSGHEKIAPCAVSGPIMVTNEYAVTECFISQKPDCSALFVATLDGQDFRRIGYIEPYCAPKE
jgi:hypothetical protein